MNTHTVRKPDDFHVHLRQGDMLKAIVPLSDGFARCLVMPNTTPPILTGQDAKIYRDQILDAGATFEPLMTLKVTRDATPAIIEEAANYGVVAGKLYPEGVTTNSQDGVRDITELAPTFEKMAQLGMILCVHGESPGIFVLDAESHFVEQTLPWLVAEFPDLRIVLEHLSTKVAVDAVRQAPPNVAATITVHHLALTLHDVVGTQLAPHCFCKPVVKRPEDREALLNAATSGDPRFFLGTDSAPHGAANKECSAGAAGVFAAPVALSVLAQLFDDAGALDRLEAFTSVNGAKFYGLAPNEETVRLERDGWTIPDRYGDVVPLWAGRKLAWRVSSDVDHASR